MTLPSGLIPFLFSADVLTEKVPHDWTYVWCGVFAFFACLLGFCYGTRAGIIARATTKEAVRQPIFWLVLLLAMVFLIVSAFIPYFSLGDDVKILKDCGLATVLICSLLIAIWTASTTITSEIENKTTMTLLSKPITRRQFIVGKYVGILQALLWLLIPLSLCLLSLIYFKVGYDSKEAGRGAVDFFQWIDVDAVFFRFQWPELTPVRWAATVQMIPGLLLVFFEAAILTAICVAVATRAPMVVNIVVCLTMYIVGHLAPVLVKISTENQLLENVQFVARMIATIHPGLDYFNTQAAVATGAMVPPIYIGYTAAYCLAYSTAALLVAFILFEDHDLA